MRRHHFHHHFVDGRANHGVTTPLWDFAFGTCQKPTTIKAQAKHPQAHEANRVTAYLRDATLFLTPLVTGLQCLEPGDDIQKLGGDLVLPNGARLGH